MGRAKRDGATPARTTRCANVISRKAADWIIDFGPEGGVKGGEIVAEGTPEDVVKVAASHTGHYLKSMLEKAS